MVPHVPGVSRIGPLKHGGGQTPQNQRGWTHFAFGSRLSPRLLRAQVGRAERPKGLDAKGSPSPAEGPKKLLGWKRATAKNGLIFFSPGKGGKSKGPIPKKIKKRGANSGEEVWSFGTR